MHRRTDELWSQTKLGQFDLFTGFTEIIIENAYQLSVTSHGLVTLACCFDVVCWTKLAVYQFLSARSCLAYHSIYQFIVVSDIIDVHVNLTAERKSASNAWKSSGRGHCSPDPILPQSGWRILLFLFFKVDRRRYCTININIRTRYLD